MSLELTYEELQACYRALQSQEKFIQEGRRESPRQFEGTLGLLEYTVTTRHKVFAEMARVLEGPEDATNG